MTEEEMRQALFGVGPIAGEVVTPQIRSVAVPSIIVTKRKEAKRFAPPKLKVTLRVGNEFEGKTELFTYEADTLSTLQAELDATRMARKKYRFIEVVTVEPGT